MLLHEFHCTFVEFRILSEPSSKRRAGSVKYSHVLKAVNACCDFAVYIRNLKYGMNRGWSEEKCAEYELGTERIARCIIQ